MLSHLKCELHFLYIHENHPTGLFLIWPWILDLYMLSRFDKMLRNFNALRTNILVLLLYVQKKIEWHVDKIHTKSYLPMMYYLFIFHKYYRYLVVKFFWICIGFQIVEIWLLSQFWGIIIFEALCYNCFNNYELFWAWYIV